MEADTEREITEAFERGREVVLSEDDGGGSRPVRAEFLTTLLLAGPTSSDSAGRQALRLRGARIVGVFDLTGTAVSAPLVLRNCVFEERPVLDDASLPSLRMPGCACPGLDATNLAVRGNLELNDGFTATGQVTLLGARIGGDVRLADAVLRTLEEGGKGVALAASRLAVDGAFLARGLDAHGQLRFISARIDGVFSLSRATLHNPGGIAFYGERLEVGESLLLQSGFVADGRVFLQNAGVKGSIEGGGATIRGGVPDKSCFQLVRGTVGRNLTLTGASIGRAVSIRSATVNGGVAFDGGRFLEPGSELNASRLRTPWINLRFAQPPGSVNLRHAKVETIEDAAASWPTELELDGCEYARLDSKPATPLKDRLEWLNRGQSSFRPFPYDQLRAAYRIAGDEQSAGRVGLEKQRRRRATLAWPGRVLGYIQDGTVGYGYRNWLAGAWMIALVAAAGFFFAAHRPAGKPEAPEFQSLVYAADLLLPIIDLGQAGAYVPQGTGRFVAWGLIAAGWVLTTAVVAGLTRVFNRST